MAFANDEKRKEYEKNGFFPMVGIRLTRTEENRVFLDALKQAAKKYDLSVPKYLLMAAREKLTRDGEI